MKSETEIRRTLQSPSLMSPTGKAGRHCPGRFSHTDNTITRYLSKMTTSQHVIRDSTQLMKPILIPCSNRLQLLSCLPVAKKGLAPLASYCTLTLILATESYRRSESNGCERSPHSYVTDQLPTIRRAQPLLSSCPRLPLASSKHTPHQCEPQRVSHSI